MALDLAQPWHLCVQTLLQSTATAFDVTARQALYQGGVLVAMLGPTAAAATAAVALCGVVAVMAARRPALREFAGSAGPH